MRLTRFWTIGLVAAAAFGAAHAQRLEGQTNRDEIKWNAFQLFIQLGAILLTCFPLSSLTGVAVPMCALTTLAAFSTSVGLLLKIFDGLLVKDEQLAPQVIMFLHSIGMKVTGQLDTVSTMGIFNAAAWADWSNSTTAAEFRNMGATVEFATETITNTIGEERPSYCFTFSIGNETASHPLADYRSTMCASELAISKLFKVRSERLPSKALSMAMRPLKKFKLCEGYVQVYELVQGLYTVFGSYTEEFLAKTLDLIQNLDQTDHDFQSLAFEIADQIDGQQEQLFWIELNKKFLL
ncbi:LAME_0D09516g1_1 [Lachancea meyersii CBS 8951]|uniref:LAME_0D09516g1_1 n=1 Tax=Lachancea meyersii CBS 8951 TaxID=1266667 RepID=A0A1G4JB99_9SACH|nr:LAME_0D09516g1_1 [Lachancea meyersii CBS 8951]